MLSLSSTSSCTTRSTSLNGLDGTERAGEVEREAIAESRLGVVYDKVLKMSSRAKAYFTHSFKLAESLKLRVFTTQDWYKDCSKALKKYQDERDDE